MTGSRTPRQRRRGLPSLLIPIGLLAMAGVLGIMTTQDRQADARDPAAAGDDLYTTHCAGCHQPNGEGIEGTFPPLAGNPAAADADYVAQVIGEGKSGPLEVNGVNYDSTMPPIAGLSDEEVGQLADHVTGLASGSSGGEVVDSTPEPEPDDSAPEPPGSDGGEAGRGQDLFSGSDRFDEGGSACASCHTAGELGNAGGSSLGPDLTDVAEKLGGAEGWSEKAECCHLHSHYAKPCHEHADDKHVPI